MDKKIIFENSPLFKKLNDLERKKLLDIAGIRNYPKNTFIFWQDESAQFFYIIYKGLVKEYRTYNNGRIKTFGIRKDMEVTSLLSMIIPHKYTVTSQTLSDTAVLAVPTLEFLDIVKDNKEFMKQLRMEGYERIEGALDEIGYTIFRNINGNLAYRLVELSIKFGIKKDNGILINLKFSQQELADMLGTNRETVCKCLQEFKDEKSIIISDKMITITNKEKLLQWQ